MTTATDIVNQALWEMGGNQPPVTGNAPDFDASTAGKAAKYLYAACVQTVQRQFSWDASRKTIELVLTGNAAPYPWTYEYGYPPSGIEVWQLSPMSEIDPNDPLPVNYVIANSVYGAPPAQGRVIQTNLQNAQAIYNNNPSENTWDALFREAVVRLLASEFSLAIGGKPDQAQSILQSGSAFESIGEGRRD